MPPKKSKPVSTENVETNNEQPQQPVIEKPKRKRLTELQQLVLGYKDGCRDNTFWDRHPHGLVLEDAGAVVTGWIYCKNATAEEMREQLEDLDDSEIAQHMEQFRTGTASAEESWGLRPSTTSALASIVPPNSAQLQELMRMNAAGAEFGDCFQPQQEDGGQEQQRGGNFATQVVEYDDDDEKIEQEEDAASNSSDDGSIQIGGEDDDDDEAANVMKPVRIVLRGSQRVVGGRRRTREVSELEMLRRDLVEDDDDDNTPDKPYTSSVAGGNSSKSINAAEQENGSERVIQVELRLPRGSISNNCSPAGKVRQQLPAGESLNLDDLAAQLQQQQQQQQQNQNSKTSTKKGEKRRTFIEELYDDFDEDIEATETEEERLQRMLKELPEKLLEIRFMPTDKGRHGEQVREMILNEKRRQGPAITLPLLQAIDVPFLK